MGSRENGWPLALSSILTHPHGLLSGLNWGKIVPPWGGVKKNDDLDFWVDIHRPERYIEGNNVHREVDMPTHASTAKRAKSDKKRRLRNRIIKSLVRTAEKKVRQAQDKEVALADLSAASSVLDKAASKGVIHRRKASRHKARLAKRVNTMEIKTIGEKPSRKK
jgi:small subunit ribosomal protein S20